MGINGLNFNTQLSFYLDDLFIAESWLLKSPNIDYYVGINPCKPKSVCFVKLSAPVPGIHVFRMMISSYGLFP